MADTLTREQIEALDALAQKATPGMWFIAESARPRSYEIGPDAGGRCSVALMTNDGTGDPDNEFGFRNADFITALVNAWPRLRNLAIRHVEELDRLRAELAKARNDVERWHFALRHCAYYSMHEAYIIDMHIRGPAGSDMVRDIDCALKREGGT